MSGLQEFLAPFSHLLFANRNFVIVLLCAVAFWAAAQALLDRWRADRLERDLSSARSEAGAAPSGRRYAAGPAIEEAPMENGGALPPVKGGRTYARNLGTALQKAGMSAPQIYSPPTPAGFAPHANPMQPPMGQPGPQPPYATPNVPWAAPAGPPPAPWAFPAAAAGGRNAPAPAPFYQPQPAPPQSPAGPPNAGAPAGFPVPGGGFPTPQPGPFAVPPASGPSAPPPAYPTYTPPAPGQMMSPPAPMPPMMAPAPQPDAGDGGRRGKPKRRRFNFNVLENLEKMVQPKAAEPSAPPAAAPIPPAAPFQAPSTASMAATATPPTAPAPAPITAPTPAPPAAETPTLPFLFGKRDAAPAKAPEPPVVPPSPPAPEPEVTATEEEQVAEVPEAPVASSPAIPTPEPVAPPEPKPEARRSMRSMMFGEEMASASATGAEPEAEDAQPAEDQATQAPAADETAPADTSDAPVTEAEQPAQEEQTAEAAAGSGSTAWPSYPWTRSDEASSSVESEPAESGGESSAEPSHEPEPAEPVNAFGSFESWKPSTSTEPEPAVEADAWKPASETQEERQEGAAPTDEHAGEAEATEAPAAAVPDHPAGTDGNGSGAGTLVIIEDDQTAASYYATLFRGNGYRVEVANDGVSGVDLCAKVQPQVILLDVMMPRQNGILVLQTLRASDETKNTPVVVMSNFSEPTLIKRAIQLGALEYVIKTQVEGPALLNALPRWINREKAFAAA